MLVSVCIQTGKFEPLTESMSPEEEEHMKNMLLRIDAIAKVIH